MRRDRRTHGIGRLIFGLVIVEFGVLLTLDHLHVIPPVHAARYWPVLLIAFGFARLLSPWHSPLWGGFWAVAGTLLLFGKLGVITWNPLALWPLVLVLLGLILIFESTRPRSQRGKSGWPRPGRHRITGAGGSR
jgi:hypothetical protein